MILDGDSKVNEAKVYISAEQMELEKLKENAEVLVSALKKIRDNPNSGIYHDGSSEDIAKEALDFWGGE